MHFSIKLMHFNWQTVSELTYITQEDEGRWELSRFVQFRFQIDLKDSTKNPFIFNGKRCDKDCWTDGIDIAFESPLDSSFELKEAFDALIETGKALLNWLYSSAGSLTDSWLEIQWNLRNSLGDRRHSEDVLQICQCNNCNHWSHRIVKSRKIKIWFKWLFQEHKIRITEHEADCKISNEPKNSFHCKMLE